VSLPGHCEDVCAYMLLLRVLMEMQTAAVTAWGG